MLVDFTLKKINIGIFNVMEYFLVLNYYNVLYFIYSDYMKYIFS